MSWKIHNTSGGFGVRQGRVFSRVDGHQNHPTLGGFGVQQGWVCSKG